MDVKDRNAFFIVLGGVSAAGILAAEAAHQSFTLVELLGGATAVGVLFGAYIGLDRLRRTGWARSRPWKTRASATSAPCRTATTG
jgi:hypothetical protein